jgi:hypothetical protein
VRRTAVNGSGRAASGTTFVMRLAAVGAFCAAPLAIAATTHARRQRSTRLLDTVPMVVRFDDSEGRNRALPILSPPYRPGPRRPLAGGLKQAFPEGVNVVLRPSAIKFILLMAS